MRWSFKIIGLSAVLSTSIALLSLRQPQTPAEETRQLLVLQSDTLRSAIRHLQMIPATRANTTRLQEGFRLVRMVYKRLEWATEYFDPLTARQINGPPVPEAEFSGLVVQPDGLQMMEELFFPRFRPKNIRELSGLLDRLSANALAFRSFFQKTSLEDWQILDALKLEIFRVEILGLNDFDDPLLRNCFAESAAALESVQAVIRHYDPEADFAPAIRYLLSPSVSSDDFDRAEFISRYANPLTRNIKTLHDRSNFPDVRYNRLLNQNAATLFDTNAFNRNAFTASPGDSATSNKIILGKLLFFDPVLSGNGKRSCASCHRPDQAFSDGLARNLDLSGKHPIARNTPTLINAALQPAQFYDQRAPSLEEQASDVLHNHDEMHGDMQIAAGKLWNNGRYRQLFEQAYPKKERTAVDTLEVTNALASYVRSLTALNSRFDDYMRGRAEALSADELRGFNLFMGKAKCSTCHYLPLFNGALPPRYMQMESEVIGVPEYKDSRQIDPDPGMHGIQALDFNLHAFKITTVRNAARTAPYMHNGIFETLEEVIDFYDKGGGTGNGIAVPNQTLPPDPLLLTKNEKTQLIAFIKSLDSR